MGSNLAETLKLGTTRDPLLGRVLGPYRIQERVGEGTGLPSYLAEHVHLERRVLFKLFHPPRGEGEAEAIRGAIQRARELSALKHEGVLPLVEIAECGDGFMYVVLELSGARPLPALLAERGRFQWPAARAMGRQIAAALLTAEAAALAGAEPTASQIFVTTAGTGEPRARVDLVTPESLGWVPARTPDLARGVGRLLYAMLAGHEPRDAEDHPLPDLVLTAPEHGIPSDADALVMRAVDPDRARRWPDLATLHRELGGRDTKPVEAATPSDSHADAASATGLGVDDEQGDVTFGRRLFARPSRPALIAGAVGVVVAIIVALAIVSGPGDGDSAATRATAEKFKVTAVVPPPQPLVLPPPPVPAPEPDEAAELDAGGALDGAVAAAPSAQPAVPATQVPAGAQEAVAAAGTSPAAAPSAAAAPPVAAAPVAAAPVAPAPVAAEPVAAIAHPVSAGAGAAPALAAHGLATPVAGTPSTLSPRPAAPAAPASAVRVSLASAAPAPATTRPGAGPAAEAAGVTAAPASRPPAEGSAPVAAVAAPAAAVPAEARQAAAAPCTLSLGSIPWSDVQVDGQRAGFTPLTDYPVSCGTHEILFTSAERGLQRRISLSVRPGEKLKRIVDLGGPKAVGAGAASGGPAPRPACRLTLGSKPWSEVWIDGNRAGTTPLVDYPVSCGTHDVLFLSRDSNVQHRESLTVQSTLKRVITLVESNE